MALTAGDGGLSANGASMTIGGNHADSILICRTDPASIAAGLNATVTPLPR
jgi:hypothetical protein